MQDGVLSATVSASTVQRHIRRNGLKGTEEAGIKDRKAYGEAYSGGMWQADTCYLPYIKEDGKSRRVYLVMILYDHFRMIVGGKLYYQESAANFQKTLKDAIAAYGTFRINCMWTMVHPVALRTCIQSGTEP